MRFYCQRSTLTRRGDIADGSQIGPLPIPLIPERRRRQRLHLRRDFTSRPQDTRMPGASSHAGKWVLRAHSEGVSNERGAILPARRRCYLSARVLAVRAREKDSPIPASAGAYCGCGGISPAGLRSARQPHRRWDIGGDQWRVYGGWNKRTCGLGRRAENERLIGVGW